jgi:hypothetical protein
LLEEHVPFCVSNEEAGQLTPDCRDSQRSRLPIKKYVKTASHVCSISVFFQ